MEILNVFKFFDKETEAKESNILNNGRGSVLLLQVDTSENACALDVYGKINNESDNYYKLQVINLTTLTNSTRISNNGMYSVSIDGVSSIYIDNINNVNSGDEGVTVFGKVGA